MSRDTFGLLREELDVMVAENRAYGGAGVFDSGAKISYRNDKKVYKSSFKSVLEMDQEPWGTWYFSLFIRNNVYPMNCSTIPFLIYVKKNSCTINM